MTLYITNNLQDFLSDPAHTDGIIFLHVTKEDADVLEELAKKYGKETKRYRINEDTDNIPAKLGED